MPISFPQPADPFTTTAQQVQQMTPDQLAQYGLGPLPAQTGPGSWALQAQYQSALNDTLNRYAQDITLQNRYNRFEQAGINPTDVNAVQAAAAAGKISDTDAGWMIRSLTPGAYRGAPTDTYSLTYRDPQIADSTQKGGSAIEKQIDALANQVVVPGQKFDPNVNQPLQMDFSKVPRDKFGNVMIGGVPYTPQAVGNAIQARLNNNLDYSTLNPSVAKIAGDWRSSQYDPSWWTSNRQAVEIIGAMAATALTAGAGAGALGAVEAGNASLAADAGLTGTAASAASGALTGAEVGAVGGGVSSAVQGGNLGDIARGALTGAATGAVGGGVGSLASGAVGGGTAGSLAGGTAGGASSGAVGAAINGGNIGQGALTGAATGLAGGAGSAVGSQIGGTTGSVVGGAVGSGASAAAQGQNATQIVNAALGGAVRGAGTGTSYAGLTSAAGGALQNYLNQQSASSPSAPTTPSSAIGNIGNMAGPLSSPSLPGITPKAAAGAPLPNVTFPTAPTASTAKKPAKEDPVATLNRLLKQASSSAPAGQPTSDVPTLLAPSFWSDQGAGTDAQQSLAPSQYSQSGG
jgi:hypothetical protein